MLWHLVGRGRMLLAFLHVRVAPHPPIQILTVPKLQNTDLDYLNIINILLLHLISFPYYKLSSVRESQTHLDLIHASVSCHKPQDVL